MKRKGQIANVLISTVLGIVIVGVMLIVGAVIFGQLNTITYNSGAQGLALNNSNTTTMINDVFSLLFTSQGVIILVVVVSLLALVIFTVMSSLGGNAKGR